MDENNDVRAVQSAAKHARNGTDSDTAVPRAKRAKYAAIACDQCKKRKVRCIQDAEGHCQRCQSYGFDCVFSHGQPQQSQDDDVNDRFARLENKVSTLQRHVDVLQGELEVIRSANIGGNPGDATAYSRFTEAVNAAMSPNAVGRTGAHRQPQFVGHTRPAFSFDVARNSLKDMGLTNDTTSFSGAATPEPDLRDTNAQDCIASDIALWNLGETEIVRLICVFDDEVNPVYPFVDIPKLIEQAKSQFGDPQHPHRPPFRMGVSTAVEQQPRTETMVLRMVVAVGKVIESLGVNDLSKQLVTSVEMEFYGMSMSSDVKYAELSVMALLSLYHFHTDEELLAWRTIGFGVRMALEMGLHRKESIVKHFPDSNQRSWATTLFWCIYVLDRRWSFGTSLPFALQDSDIDPELPEPNSNAEYLRCMVKYGRICSKVWGAFPSFGSPGRAIPNETVSYLEFQIQNWINAIPQHLRLGRLDQAKGDHSHDDRVKQRLRALLYLRGNHVRILINRHHLMSTSNIRADVQAAQRVVDLATDTVQVLVQLNGNSDIYLRQQAAFNYFLVSALAAIFLAVCHEPRLFGIQCKHSFYNAVELVRTFSARSHVSKRLWKSIRGLLPAAQKLGLHHGEQSGAARKSPKRMKPIQHAGLTPQIDQRNTSNQSTGLVPNTSSQGNVTQIDPSVENSNSNPSPSIQQTYGTSPSNSTSLPDMNQVTDDLTNWYETFGLMEHDGFGIASTLPDGDETFGLNDDSLELSRVFQELISG